MPWDRLERNLASQCHMEAETKRLSCCWQHFQIHFIACKLLYLVNISQKFVPVGWIDNKLILVQFVPWHRTCDKPLFESVVAYFTYATLSLHNLSMGGPIHRHGHMQTVYAIKVMVMTTGVHFVHDGLVTSQPNCTMQYSGRIYASMKITDNYSPTYNMNNWGINFHKMLGQLIYTWNNIWIM